MGLSEHNNTNISPPNCSKIMILGKKAFLIMLFQNVAANPIISEI